MVFLFLFVIFCFCQQGSAWFFIFAVPNLPYKVGLWWLRGRTCRANVHTPTWKTQHGRNPNDPAILAAIGHRFMEIIKHGDVQVWLVMATVRRMSKRSTCMLRNQIVIVVWKVCNTWLICILLSISLSRSFISKCTQSVSLVVHYMITIVSLDLPKQTQVNLEYDYLV